jgi:hypothetical protein
MQAIIATDRDAALAGMTCRVCPTRTWPRTTWSNPTARSSASWPAGYATDASPPALPLSIRVAEEPRPAEAAHGLLSPVPAGPVPAAPPVPISWAMGTVTERRLVGAPAT